MQMAYHGMRQLRALKQRKLLIPFKAWAIASNLSLVMLSHGRRGGGDCPLDRRRSGGVRSGLTICLLWGDSQNLRCAGPSPYHPRNWIRGRLVDFGEEVAPGT